MIIDAIELKRRYEKRVAGVRDNKIYIGPEILTIELTNACNIRCQFCYADHSLGNPAHFNKARHLSLERFVEAVRDCVDLNVDQVTVMGTGEPTIHPSFRDMMGYLKNQPLYVKVYTNATFPMDFCSDVITADKVIVNLSSVDRQHYHDLQGKDFFDRVVGNIQRLVSMRDSHKPEFKIEIAYIVNALNVNEMRRMEELGVKLKVDLVDFQKMRPYTYNQNISLSEHSVSELDVYRKENPPRGLNGWFFVLLTSDGNFNNCYKNSHVYGDFHQSSLKEFWLSPEMMKLRLLGKSGRLQGVGRNFA